MPDLFQLKRFSLRQSNRVFRITTDSILLGAYASFSAPKYLLDIGTGTGIVALMMAQKHAGAQIFAVDINPAAVELSRDNFFRSPWARRLHAVEADIRSWNTNIMFDGIVANPPYFLHSLVSEDDDRTIARHDKLLSYRDLARIGARLLTENGFFYVIIPSDNAKIIEREFNFEYLFCQKRLYICSKKGRRPNREIMMFGRRIERCMDEELCIMEGDSFTSRYMELTRDFYINF